MRLVFWEIFLIPQNLRLRFSIFSIEIQLVNIKVFLLIDLKKKFRRALNF